MGEESRIEQETCELALIHLGIISSKLVTPGDTGMPDRIFWLPGGKVLLIEFKRPGEEPRAKQVHQHQILIKLGYRVETHDSKVDAFEAIIRAVETKGLSKESREILDRARRVCSVLRSRIR